jgi:transposase
VRVNTKLHAVRDGKGRPLSFLITTGQVRDDMGAAALLGSLPAAEWLIANRSYDADWLREALKDKGYAQGSRARSRAASPTDTKNAVTTGGTGSRSNAAD